jgi:hypothetical protein
MVRVKFRYLVVNFLYPEPLAKSKTSLPDLVQIHSPTPDAFHAGVLMRLIRDEVEELFGDYGMGMLSSGLKGTQYNSRRLSPPPTHTIRYSQLLVPQHLDRHYPLPARPLRNGLGGTHIHYAPAETRRRTGCDTHYPGERHHQEGGGRGHSAVAAHY